MMSMHHVQMLTEAFLAVVMLDTEEMESAVLKLTNVQKELTTAQLMHLAPITLVLLIVHVMLDTKAMESTVLTLMSV